MTSLGPTADNRGKRGGPRSPACPAAQVSGVPIACRLPARAQTDKMMTLGWLDVPGFWDLLAAKAAQGPRIEGRSRYDDPPVPPTSFLFSLVLVWFLGTSPHHSKVRPSTGFPGHRGEAGLAGRERGNHLHALTYCN